MCREPYPDEDREICHPIQHEYLVVRRYGRSFNILLQSANSGISVDDLELVYQKILDNTAKNNEALTADHRDTWIHVCRETSNQLRDANLVQHKANLLEFNAISKDSIKTIEASTFVVSAEHHPAMRPIPFRQQKLQGV